MPSHSPQAVVSDFPVLQSKRFFLKTLGCQMNSSDSEIVSAILQQKSMAPVDSPSDCDVLLLNTCAIRENAEQKIWNLIDQFNAIKEVRQREGRPFVIGILGCMAERLKARIVEERKTVDLVAGPDAYRDLPRLLSFLLEDVGARGSHFAINTQLSMDETYADVRPIRQGQVAAYLSIMRGCSNMCAFCIVPFTRGVERSRPLESILDEVRQLRDSGVKEITLLGQNVNSYFDQTSETFQLSHQNARGFGETYRRKSTAGARFVHLLDAVSELAPEVRFRFTSPHPKDFPDPVLELIRERPNLCKYLHMPAQSGSTSVLDRMNRKYTSEAYRELVGRARELVPGLTLSTDLIAGFCGETEQEFEESVSLLRDIGFDFASLLGVSVCIFNEGEDIRA